MLSSTSNDTGTSQRPSQPDLCTVNIADDREFNGDGLMFKTVTEETFKVRQAPCLCLLLSTEEALLSRHKYTNTMRAPG